MSLQIMATAYIRHEPWEMGVHKRNGVVYLDVHKLPERPQSDLDRRRYWAYFFIFYYAWPCKSLCELHWSSSIGTDWKSCVRERS